MKRLILSGFVFFFLIVGIVKVNAKGVDKITWCHVEPNGNQQTLELPQQALEQAGHVDANGNPLHAGDHPGACVDTVPTITVVPTQGITPTVTPGVTATPSATPTVEPTTPPNQGGPGDGRSDGRSSCPECTQAPKVENKSGQPIINQVGWK